MSQELISRNRDLMKLRDDGYNIDVRCGHLVVYDIPYVDSGRRVRRDGILVSVLGLVADETVRPPGHVAMFSGDHPCDEDGRALERIKHSSGRQEICDGLSVDHLLSNRPPEGYKDYHHKMSHYVNVISHYAQKIDPDATPRTRRVAESSDPASVFNYQDTASSRAGITSVSRKLEKFKIAIVGLGGTGSYILDLVAKTPVGEIHLFDGDDFWNHNAFRSPGAATVDELKEEPRKVHYLKRRYDPMRKGIFAYDFPIDETNLQFLNAMDFVFLCVDRGNEKLPIIERLESLGISFIDVGMGINLVDGELLGIIRTTASTDNKRDHVRDRIDFSRGGQDDVYSRNIQTADLNALNAALAVIKWKKLCGFYMDSKQEHNSCYNLNTNKIINEN